MKKFLKKISKGYKNFIKKHNITDDDIFGVKLIIGIFVIMGLVALAISYAPEEARVGLFFLVLLLLGLYSIYYHRKEIIEFIGELFGGALELAKGLGAILLIIGIIAGIIAVCVWLFGAVGGGVAGVLAVFFLLRILGIL